MSEPPGRIERQLRRRRRRRRRGVLPFPCHQAPHRHDMMPGGEHMVEQDSIVNSPLRLPIAKCNVVRSNSRG